MALIKFDAAGEIDDSFVVYAMIARGELSFRRHFNEILLSLSRNGENN